MASTDTRSGFRLPWSSDRSPETPAAADGDSAAWPSSDLDDRLGPDSQPRAADLAEPADLAPESQEPEMIDTEHVPPPAPVVPRKPSKLMVDLAAAIRATAEAARDQAIAQVDADVSAVVELIREGAKEGEDALRVRSDEDIARIKEWSRAEIARIKEETEHRIGARKLGLDEELAAHAAAIEQRIGEVEGTVASYRLEMDAYAERLGVEDDPAHLATLAESMPEPPALDGWADLDDTSLDLAAEVGAGVLGGDAVDDDQPDAAESSEAEARLEADGGQTAVAVDDVPRWTADEESEGFPGTGAEAGDPVDRGAIMAALEAAAEAVVAAESAAESADQAEAAADVAETAAELLKGRVEGEDDVDPDAAAAMSARVDAGGFEESYADRLASLLPGHAEGAADGEPRTTQVIVTGLVSVASIASFKRHLGRLGGVQAVAVASGPEGEFVFNVTHRPDVSFRDAVPTMPGFAARVTSTTDCVVQVTARDPEAEG